MPFSAGAVDPAVEAGVLRPAAAQQSCALSRAIETLESQPDRRQPSLGAPALFRDYFCRVNNLYASIAGESSLVEREDGSEAMRLHGGHQASIVRWLS